MKPTKLILSALAVASLAACSDSNDDKMTVTFAAPMLNLVTTPGEQPTISSASYAVNINYTDQEVTVSLPSAEIGGSKLAFTTPNLKYTFRNNSFWFNHISELSATSGQTLTGVNGFVTDAIYLPPQDFTGSPIFNNICLNMRYVINGKSTVQTFPADAVYAGNTQGSAGSSSFDNVETLYRVVIDSKKMEATVYMYKARFAEQMPQLNFAITGLKVTPMAASYKIEGENLVPVTADGAEYPNFAFDSFTLLPLSSDLTTVKIDFSVAGRYKGAFMGSYIPTSM